VHDNRAMGLEDNVLRLPQTPEAIELRHLRAFVAVAEELNFGRAAARLYLTQPALSRQISGLERLVGCQLLRRSTRSVELTLAGGMLLGRARDLLRDLNDAVTATRSVGNELEERVARIWAPVAERARTTSTDLDSVRTAYESVGAMFPVPERAQVRPVTAGGVSCLAVSPDHGRPASVLYCHGGAMVMGSAYGYRSLAGALAVAAGQTVLVPDFRLAPEHPFPAALDDVTQAYEWLLDRGVAARDVTVCGDSMGGLLVLSMLLRLVERGAELPGRAVLLCPSVRLAPLASATPEEAAVVRNFAAAYLGGHPSDDPIVNPLTADLTGLPPVLVQAATGDFAIEHSHLFAEHARECGVEVELDIYPVTAHVFHLFWPFLPDAATALEKVGDFMRG
jgi:epsilon-lactone hydrolase